MKSLRSSAVVATVAMLAVVITATFGTFSSFSASAQARKAEGVKQTKAGAESPAAAFIPGDLVVYRVGDGTATLTNLATAVFLDEYSPVIANQAAPVQSIAMPIADSGLNQTLTAQGTATSEGFLQRSQNQLYLMVPGYDKAPGGTAPASDTGATTPRVTGRVNSAGVVDTTTAIADSSGNFRAVASTDGANIWAGTSSSGVRYFPYGATASVQLNTTPTNTRVPGIFAGQLYVSAASGAFQGVSTVGTGLPTTTGQTLTQLTGFPTATGPSPYQFQFVNSNTLYVADDRAVASGGGIQKWTNNAGTWTLATTLNNGLTGGARGLVYVLNGLGQPVFYATTSDNKLVTITDDGTPTGTAAVTLATAPTNTAFRGVAFAPLAATASNVSVSGRVTSAEGRGIRNATVTISGGALAQPITVTTGPKGRFTFDEIPSGESYVVTVSARRFVFDNPSRVIEVNDNIADVNFVSEN